MGTWMEGMFLLRSTRKDCIHYLRISMITEHTIEAHLSTTLAGSPPLDVFVRTSGVKRLSGFLTWQVCRPINQSSYALTILPLRYVLASNKPHIWLYLHLVIASMTFCFLLHNSATKTPKFI